MRKNEFFENRIYCSTAIIFTYTVAIMVLATSYLWSYSNMTNASLHSIFLTVTKIVQEWFIMFIAVSTRRRRTRSSRWRQTWRGCVWTTIRKSVIWSSSSTLVSLNWRRRSRTWPGRLRWDTPWLVVTRLCIHTVCRNV